MEARLIYATSEKSADLFYATRFFAPDPFLFVQERTGTTHMLVSVLEVDRARRSASVDHVHDWNALKKQYEQHVSGTAATTMRLIVLFLKDKDIQQVLVPEECPLGLADYLRHAGITVTPATGSFWPERHSKRPEEVAAIETALTWTGEAMALGIDMIRRAQIGKDGWLYHHEKQLTSEQVRGEINAFLVRHGAMPQHTIVSAGTQSADPHEEGSGPLAAHQPIILDIFPRMEKSGYWGDMTRTVCRGQPSTRLQKAWQAVRDAQEIAFAQIRAGCEAHKIHAAVCTHFDKAGFPTGRTSEGRQKGFFHGTGHGLGLEVHEYPRISHQEQILRVGHVVTVEPGLYYPDMGGVRLEDVVLVEAEGCRNLTKFPKFLIL